MVERGEEEQKFRFDLTCASTQGIVSSAFGLFTHSQVEYGLYRTNYSQTLEMCIIYTVYEKTTVNILM